MKETVGCLLLFGLLAAIDFLVAWVFQALWNWIMPYLFHLPTITYWMAFGITVLLSIVGGFFKPRSK